MSINGTIFSLAIIFMVFIVIWTRINERKKLDAQKDEFIALAAHYLMTPLAIIKGNIAEIVGEKNQKTADSDLRSRYLNIESSTNKLLLLVQNMLTVSQIDQHTLRYNSTPIDLDNFVYDCLADVGAEAEQKQIHLVYHRPDNQSSLIQIKADREKLRQSMLNILSNALKFTAAGGGVEVFLAKKSRGFSLNISDSGIGISAQERSLLFTRFHRGTSYLDMDYEGIGLGLYIARYLIEQGGGEISVDSEVGKGTKVTLTIPFESH